MRLEMGFIRNGKAMKADAMSFFSSVCSANDEDLQFPAAVCAED